MRNDYGPPRQNEAQLRATLGIKDQPGWKFVPSTGGFQRNRTAEDNKADVASILMRRQQPST